MSDDGICRHVHIVFQTCNSDTREGARTDMTDFYRIWIGMEFHSCPMSFPALWGFLSLTVSCKSSNQKDDRPFRLWPCPLFPDSWMSWLKLHESPLEHCPRAFHWKHSPTFLSTQASFPFWLLVTDPLSTTSFRTLKFRVLIIWLIWSFTAVFNLW